MLDFFVYTYLTPSDSPPPSPPPHGRPGGGGPGGPPWHPSPPQPPPNQSTGSKTNLAAPVGGAVGGVLGVVILAAFALWYFHRRKQRQQQQHARMSQSPRFADTSAYVTGQTTTPWTNPTFHTTTPSMGSVPSNSRLFPPSSPHLSSPPGRLSRLPSTRTENPPPPVYDYHGV